MKEFSDFVRESNNSDFAQTPTWNDAVSLVGSMPSAERREVQSSECEYWDSESNFCSLHRPSAEPRYCDRNICASNEVNGISCDECEIAKYHNLEDDDSICRDCGGGRMSRKEVYKACTVAIPIGGNKAFTEHKLTPKMIDAIIDCAVEEAVKEMERRNVQNGKGVSQKGE